MFTLTINAYWVYGYSTSELGEYKYDRPQGTSEFHSLGGVYPSSYMMSVELSNRLFFYQKDIPYHVYEDYTNKEVPRVEVLKNKGVVGFKIKASIDDLNRLPDKEILDSFNLKLKELLIRAGCKNLPEPQLFFLVSTEEDH